MLKVHFFAAQLSPSPPLPPFAQFAAAVGNEGLSSFVAAFALDEVKLTVLEVCTDIGLLGMAISVPLGLYVYRNWRTEGKGYEKLR